MTEMCIRDREYEKDGVIQQGYSIQKAYDISQIRTKQPEEAEPKQMCIRDSIGTETGKPG